MPSIGFKSFFSIKFTANIITMLERSLDATNYIYRYTSMTDIPYSTIIPGYIDEKSISYTLV